MDEKIKSLKYCGTLFGDIKYYLSNPMNILIAIGIFMIISFLTGIVLGAFGFIILFIGILLWSDFS